MGNSKKRSTGRSPSAERKQRKGSQKTGPQGRTAEIAETLFPIVGIGSSAGGLEALEEFFDHVPPNSGIAFIVVSHQPAGRTSLLPDLLGKHTQLKVTEARDGLSVHPNHLYLAPAGCYLALLNGAFQVIQPPTTERISLPIDYLFRSVAVDRGHRAIGVILSGTGTDGTLGLKAIKGEAGMTMVQDPATAQYDGMPKSAIGAGVVDFVLPVDQLPTHLIAYAQGRYVADPPARTPLELEPSQVLSKIFVLIRDRTGMDFSVYKEATMRRRVERRMTIQQLERPNEYLRFLQEHPHEVDALFGELLIGVTSFFRDPAAFDAFVEKCLPQLVDGRKPGVPIRVWVAGCSTGEEAYSMAILLREFMTSRKQRVPIQIFGTDVDKDAIQTARTALYPSGIIHDISAERLERFFTKEDSYYRVTKEIRDLVVFAPHNVLADPPFTKLDVLCCRNLLIYLKPEAQKRLLPLLHYALKPGGYLMLGSSETVEEYSDFFSTVDRKWKLYARTETATDRIALEHVFPVTKTGSIYEHLFPAEANKAPKPVPIAQHVHQMLLEQYAPPSVVTTGRGQIVFIHGRTGDYLEPAPGQPSNDLLAMARQGLREELGVLLHKLGQEETSVVHREIQVLTNGDIRHVKVTARKLSEPKGLQGLIVLAFQDLPPMPSEAPQKKPKSKRTSDREAQLARELRFTKERLQTSLEQLQAANEDLKSSNEELQSMNEELQSSNEELETAKEELQSLNEELVTVNNELRGKVEDLGQANDDLQNLIDSTEIGTIYLDGDLHVTRFTPEARHTVNLIPSDVGRPLSDLVSNLRGIDLNAEARQVMRRHVPAEHEVQNQDGEWYLLRIHPYRTARNTIEGLILTFFNISTLKRSQLETQHARAYAESIVASVREPLIILDAQLQVVSANQAFYRTFHLRPEEVERHPIYQLAQGQWNIPRLRQLLEEILPQNTTFQDFKIAHEFTNVGAKVLLLNARRLKPDPRLSEMILLAMEDVTNHKEAPQSDM